jgi:hypothetical protein
MKVTEEQKQKYIAAQKAWLEMTGLKVGDKVKVTRAFKEGEFGWCGARSGNALAMSRKLSNVGNILTVTEIYGDDDHPEDGIALDSYFYPFFVLEPIQEEPSLSGSVVEVKINGKSYKATIH